MELGGDFKLIGPSFSVWIKVHLSDLMPEFHTIAMFVKLNVLKKISRIICKSVHSHLSYKAVRNNRCTPWDILAAFVSITVCSVQNFKITHSLTYFLTLLTTYSLAHSITSLLTHSLT